MDEGLREKRRDEVRCGMSVFLYRIDMDGGLLSVERATSYSRVNAAGGRIVSKDTSSFFSIRPGKRGKQESADEGDMCRSNRLMGENQSMP